MWVEILPFFVTKSKKVTIYEWPKNWYDFEEFLKIQPFK